LNLNGAIAARARTAWLLVDASTRRITSLNRLPAPVPYLGEYSALDAFPEKIVSVEGGELVLEKQVSYSDLDLNQHVNNTRYVEAILDCYPPEHHCSHKIVRMVFSFQSKSKFGDRLAVYRTVDEKTGRHHLTAQQSGSDKPIFQALIDWV
jgi:medium-chain acyl-[acyl-carrier-protein] hydrolase